MTLKVNLNLLADNNGVAGEALTQDQITVNDSFFVEIEVADIRDDAAGVIGLALDIEWDASVLEASDTEITDKLSFNQQGTIDNDNGLVDDLGGGAIPNADIGEAIGINDLERFALIRFEGELATDSPIPLTVTVSDPRSVAFADNASFNSDDTEIEAQTIDVVAENSAPTLANEITDTTATEDSAFSFTVPENTFNDTDAGDTLTYSATLEDGSALPTWVSFDAGSRTFSGTPDNSDVGSLDIEVTATDSSNEAISDRFILAVENVDDAPTVANAIGNLTVDEDADDSVINLSDVFTDIDNDDTAIVKTVLTNTNDTLVNATVDGNNLTLDYLDNQSGTADITIQGTSNGLTVEETFTVAVDAVDDAPIVTNAIANLTVDEDADDSVINLSDVFTDIDNDDTAIVKTVLTNTNDTLVNATVDGNNLTLDYLDNQSGTADITIQGTSNGLTVEETFTVTVDAVDDAPIVSNRIEDVTVDENADDSVIDLSNVFSDADGDAIALSITENTNNSLVTPALDGNNLTLDFLDDQFGSGEITIAATANGQTISDTFVVTVNEVIPTNNSPTLENPLADLTTPEESEFSLTIPADTFDDRDPDDTLTYSASLEDNSALPTWLTFDADTQNFSGTPADSDVGTLNIKVTATDNSNAIASDVFILTVEDVVEPEALISIADSSGDADDASIQFTTPLSQFRADFSDSELVRPSYPDNQQYLDITNTGDGVLNISEININADGVTADIPDGDILINPDTTQRIQLTYTPSAANENFSIDDGITIVSNAANDSTTSVSLSGKSTFDSDISYDGIVSFGDLGSLNANWGSENADAGWDASADINGDGSVNSSDVDVLNGQWNQELTFI